MATKQEKLANKMAVKDAAIEILIDGAQQHGEDSEPDHEVGDLQDFLRAMWGMLTPRQRKAFFKLEDVERTFDGILMDFDSVEEALAAAEVETSGAGAQA